ncbi:hypothetical protein F2Q70_00017818 [Brassica cretica]|uniref:Uncharacterized protein n=1 Tax=Brassica cretica TaxID=69181 RepID=A0A8S9I4P2_BRACR|nr:hypothetical protein F2Q70_00017818 [Brassica cretica]KAF2599939.1 hypothetical protein F2Q68_00010772 [Brassica cretica]
MVSRRWDPGIGEEDSTGANIYQDKYHGDTDWDFFSKQRWAELVMEKVISERLRKHRNIADRISISINIKMESQFYQAYSEAVADGRRRDHGLENKAFEIRYLGMENFRSCFSCSGFEANTSGE